MIMKSNLTLSEDTISYYEVSDDGDLAIRVESTISAATSSILGAEIQFSQESVVEKDENGENVIKLLQNGSATYLSTKNQDFNTTFKLRTSKSTLLPKNYILLVNTSLGEIKQIITPQWNRIDSMLSSGKGSSFAPYITSFYAYDSYKGTPEHVKTYIYNPSPFMERDVTSLKYKIKSYNYPQWPIMDAYWEEWASIFSENGYIDPQRTYVVHDYLDFVFSASSKWYALNTGSYKISEVYASGGGLGGSWSDSYNPTTSQGEFDVWIDSDWHPVFVVSLTSSLWKSIYGNDAAYYINQASDRFESRFDIELVPVLELTWSPSSGKSCEDILDDAKVIAGSLLGLNRNWWGANGMDKYHHGFDILGCFTGYYSDYCGMAGSRIDNNFVCTRGNNFGNFPYVTLYSADLDNMVQHEISHLYNADDRLDIEYWYGQPSVMSKPTGCFANTNWGPPDGSLMQVNEDLFDEPL